MKKRTWFARVSAGVAMSALLLAGCSSPATETGGSSEAAQSPDSTASEGAAPSSDISLTYWSMWSSTENQAKVIQEAADAYTASTGIPINIEWKGRDVKNLIIPALQAGEEIDFFDQDYIFISRNSGEYVADLTEMAEAAGYEEHIMPVLAEKAKSYTGGVLKVMPYQPYTTGVWYNKDMFEAAGITEVPETWDEFLEVCRKLKDSGVNAITCNTSDGVDMLYGYQLGRYIGQDAVLEMIDNCDWANVPEAYQAADDIATLFREGYMSPYAPAQYPDGQNEIGYGESCMILNASWIPNEIAQNTGASINWGFFPWPTVEGGVDGHEASMVGGQGFGIVDGSQHKQEAFDFILSVVTGETDAKMAEMTTTIPADTANTTWPAAVAEAEPYFKEVTKAYEWNVGMQNNANYKDQIVDALIRLYKGELDTQGFIDTLAALK